MAPRATRSADTSGTTVDENDKVLSEATVGLIDPATRLQLHGFSQGVAAAARWLSCH